MKKTIKKKKKSIFPYAMEEICNRENFSYVKKVTCDLCYSS